MIEFELKDNDCEIRIANYKKDLKRLIDPSKVLIKNKGIYKFIMEFTYPLHKKVVVEGTCTEDLTKKDLVSYIAETYHRIYKEEEEFMKETIEKLEDIKSNSNVINRPASSGVHGIWGHDLRDLILEGVDIQKEKEPNLYKIILYIGS